ncbi:hypothetical protein Tco_0602512 [Tanacetum coccineum]
MARQCSQPKRPMNAAWFKEKAIQAAQTTIPNTAAFQTEYLDAYDFDCNDVSNAKVVLMANLSNYGSDVISKKAQRIKPIFYDGSVISSQQATCLMINDEETLVLEGVKLSDKQAFWLQTSHPNTDQSALLPVQIEAPKELPKYFVDKHCFEIHKKELFLENDRLLQKIMSQDLMICVMNSTAVFDNVNVEMQSSESCVKCLNLDAELLKKQNVYNDLSKSFSQLEKHFISLELIIQLNQEIFQKDSVSNNQNALEILEYFKNNDLKAQLQAKDTTICKLKEHIKSMRENDKEEKVKHEMDEIETINIELEHSVAKLLSENEHLHKEIKHLKKIYKDHFDSIKKTCALSKEHGDSLIAQLNSKSMENADLKRQIQDKSAKKSQHHNIWKPTGKVFTEVGHKWKPTGRLFTIVGNSCPLTRITPKKIVHLKETTSISVETSKPEIKVYSRRPKQVKSVGSSKKAKIVQSKIANNSEPTHLWGSNATDVPSSSSLVNDRLSRLFSGIWTPDAQNI